MNFTEVDLSSLKRGTEKKPVLRISKGGSMGLNRNALSVFGISEPDKNKYAHFVKDEAGSYWIYINEMPKNGLKIRFQVKAFSLDGVIQCSGFVKQLISELDLPIAPDKKSSVRLDIAVENPIKIKGAGTAYKLY